MKHRQGSETCQCERCCERRKKAAEEYLDRARQRIHEGTCRCVREAVYAGRLGLDLRALVNVQEDWVTALVFTWELEGSEEAKAEATAAGLVRLAIWRDAATMFEVLGHQHENCAHAGLGG